MPKEFYALKIAYAGKYFSGAQSQPNARTVEGELLNALKFLKVCKGKRENRLRVLSRTDAGVSALENVCTFDAERDFEPGILNSMLSDDIFVLGYSKKALSFPGTKTYRYYLYGKRDIVKLKKIAKLFEGEHDFKAFSKSAKVGGKLKETVRKLGKVTVRKTASGAEIDFVGTGFLWQMVRRIVAAMVAFEAGDVAESRIREMIKKPSRERPKPAPAEHLVLLKADFGVKFRAVKSKRSDLKTKVTDGLCKTESARRFMKLLKT